MIYRIQMLLLNWLTILILLLEETNISFLITDFTMIYVITVFLLVLLIFGIVYLTMLSMFILLIFFKTRLGRFWANQDVKYDFTADLTGTGDRSVYEVCDT